jgi:hypothetical protein
MPDKYIWQDVLKRNISKFWKKIRVRTVNIRVDLWWNNFKLQDVLENKVMRRITGT